MKKYLLGIGVALVLTSAFPFIALAAVTFDSISLNPWAGSNTWSHTVSGTNTILIVAGHCQPAGNIITGITYNGVAMTPSSANAQAGYANNGDMYLYYLLNPATGTHSVVISGSCTGFSFTSFSLNGASQMGLDSSNFGAGSASQGSPLTLSTTVSEADSMLVGVFQDVDGGWTSSTNTSAGVYGDGVSHSATSTSVVGTGTQSLSFTRSGTSRVNGWIIASVAPASSGLSHTTNFLAKFINSTDIDDSLLFDDGSNMTLTSGNFFIPVGSMIDAISNGAISFGTSLATTMTFGRSGQSMIINSNLSVGTTTVGSIKTSSNCISVASPAICGSASAGSVAVATGGSTLTVNTSAVTPNSQILITEDSSLGTRLGITCNTSTGRTYSISSRVAGTSFTIKSNNNPVTNKACLGYFIVN